VRDEASDTIELSKRYVRMVKDNNQRVYDLLESSYSYVDPDDAALFSQFVVDYVRNKTEVDATGKLVTPLEVYELVGSISFMRQDFIDRVRERFTLKKAELQRHAGIKPDH